LVSTAFYLGKEKLRHSLGRPSRSDFVQFAFKNYIKIINAVVASYKGRPIGLQEACNQLNQYIMEHKLQPKTVGYNVTKKTDMLNPENTEIDVYVGISPNIL